MKCLSLKPVLRNGSQTGFVTVDDFIALYTCSDIFYSHRCNKFSHARTFFTLADADTITPIFTVLTKVWRRANQAIFTNNKTVLTKVRANRNHVKWKFLVLCHICAKMSISRSFNVFSIGNANSSKNIGFGNGDFLHQQPLGEFYLFLAVPDSNFPYRRQGSKSTHQKDKITLLVYCVIWISLI